MDKLNILIVEDNDTQINNYNDWVDEFNEQDGNEFSISIFVKKTADEAKKLLNSTAFQGAIVDLNLLGEPPESASGNLVIEEIINEFRIPVVVVSGNIGNLEGVGNTAESAFLKKFNRDEDNNIIFGELIKIFETGVFNIIGGRGEIEKGLAKVFWDHLSNDLDAWIPSNSRTERTLLRYTLNHLTAYLTKSEDGYFHEAEFYIKPPIKDEISSGDLVLDSATGKRFILLSPACDVELRSTDNGSYCINAKSLLLGEIIDCNPTSLFEANLITSATSKDKFKTFVTRSVRGTEPKVIYLPKHKALRDGVVDLQGITTINFSQFKELKRLATISESFFKDIQSKFSAYYSRQGQPDLNKNTIIQDTVDEYFGT